ncbi:MAG: hypothetical protein O2985_12590 [Proteobacteria bacterium]|nr:hypothetical protein [Pseudomonadota bacterium]
MRWTSIIFCTITLLITTSGAMALSPAERAIAALCDPATRKAEAAEALPRGLLAAISLKETGRWDPDEKRSIAWPWTVTSEGKGIHHASKDDALARVKELQARGVTNIDVGCLQINLYYHPQAFETLDDALDPVKNAAYAGAHLRQLRRDHRSWQRAVEHYHSSDPKRGRDYRMAVYRLKYGPTKAPLVAAHEKATSSWKERQQVLRKKYVDAKKSRVKTVRQLREAKEQQNKLLRAAYEARRAKVFQNWEKMMQKRRDVARGKRS